MKYARYWVRCVGRRGTHWTFADNYICRVELDLTSLARPYAVVYRNKRIASYARLAAAKTAVLRKLVELAGNGPTEHRHD
jgi:hypothetical protein